MASGQMTSIPLSIALVDHDRNVAKTDNSSQAELQPTDSLTTIGGITKVTAVQGVFYFDEFIIVGTLGIKLK
ncbi:unnamed protein product [Blepharisma stoltei]|uniref:Dirigent protein n=1 Tax=Blepharisma stoltei TaxID=1481888 RepID=A0AAU9I452_9CILI|nr:unnamed protein product [Blepharisma stoltei]